MKPHRHTLPMFHHHVTKISGGFMSETLSPDLPLNSPLNSELWFTLKLPLNQTDTEIRRKASCVYLLQALVKYSRVGFKSRSKCFWNADVMLIHLPVVSFIFMSHGMAGKRLPWLQSFTSFYGGETSTNLFLQNVSVQTECRCHCRENTSQKTSEEAQTQTIVIISVKVEII